MRGRVMAELSEPPEWLLALSERDRKTLNGVLKRAHQGATEGSA